MRPIFHRQPFSRRLTGMLLAAWVLWSVGAPQQPASAAEEPLRGETIVQLHMQGTSRRELIRLIRERQVDFDVSTEILTELRLAGLDESVIDAMIDRQRQMDRERERGRENFFEGAGVTLKVLLNPDRKRARQGRLRIGEEVNPKLASLWRLDSATDQRKFRDVAVFLACRTHDHVPDGWRALTPLGSDPQPMERHRMLAFAPGARWNRGSFLSRFGFAPTLRAFNTDRQNVAGGASIQPGPRQPGHLELMLPDFLEVRLQSGVEHDLTVGIALLVGHDYYHWKLSSVDGVLLGNDPLTLEARLKSGNSKVEALDIDFDHARARKSGGFLVHRSR
jgi:hypothetical protein